MKMICQHTFLLLLSVSTFSVAFKSFAQTNNPVPEGVVSALTASWTNELGSTLIITAINPQTGAVSGNYRSPSGTSGQAFPLCGWVNTKTANRAHTNNVTVVSFSVRWETIGSITSWSGYYAINKEGKESIVGQWLLTRPNSDYPWDHIVTGQDRFYKIAGTRNR